MSSCTDKREFLNTPKYCIPNNRDNLSKSPMIYAYKYIDKQIIHQNIDVGPRIYMHELVNVFQ